MSTQVVTPPAAAVFVVPSMPDQPSADPVCTCPSTSPGKISAPERSNVVRAAGGLPRPTSAIFSPAIATYAPGVMLSSVTTVPRTTASNMRASLLCVGWVERSETHPPLARGDGFHSALPILQHLNSIPARSVCYPAGPAERSADRVLRTPPHRLQPL